MNALKRLKSEGRQLRYNQAFLVDVLNIMSAAYSAELHQSYGFGAERCNKLTASVIQTVHDAIKRYRETEDDDVYVWQALNNWCKDFGFDPAIGLDTETGAVKFVGGVIK